MSVAKSKTLVADINEAMKDSGSRALARHAKLGLPIVYSENGKNVLEYADGRKVVLEKKD
jgi:hypothetical protein